MLYLVRMTWNNIYEVYIYKDQKYHFPYTEYTNSIRIIVAAAVSAAAIDEVKPNKKKKCKDMLTFLWHRAWTGPPPVLPSSPPGCS